MCPFRGFSSYNVGLKLRYSSFPRLRCPRPSFASPSLNDLKCYCHRPLIKECLRIPHASLTDQRALGARILVVGKSVRLSYYGPVLKINNFSAVDSCPLLISVI